MIYRVDITAPAERDIYAEFDRIREQAPTYAEKWFNGIVLSILSLSTLPNRCPMIAEATELGPEMRQLLYGKRSGTFRIIFDIRVTAEGENQVRILCVRRGSRDKLQPEDLKELEN